MGMNTQEDEGALLPSWPARKIACRVDHALDMEWFYRVVL
jgi:hypothetical protein